MSETDTNLGTPPTGTPPTPPAPASAPAAKGSGVFAAYDERYLRYVGGTHDSKSAAKSAAKDAGVPAASTRIDEV